MHDTQYKAAIFRDALQLDSYLHKASNILVQLVRLNDNANPQDLTYERILCRQYQCFHTPCIWTLACNGSQQ